MTGMTEDVAAVRWPGVARIRAWSRCHPLAADAVLAAILMVLTSVLWKSGELSPRALVFGIQLQMPLVWRRRYPLAAFGCMAVVACVQWLVSQVLGADVGLLVGLYTVAAYRELSQALLAYAVLEFGVVIAVFRWAPVSGRLSAFVALSGLATAAFVLGRNVRTRRAYLASLEDRARRAENERDQRAQLAAAAERASIAREMHDIVAHNLSVMIALADGAAFAARGRPAEAEAAARQVSSTGRQALTEMRRLLGVLRGDEQAAMRAPQPGLDQFDYLLTQVRAAGLPVSLTVQGRPFPLPPTTQLTVYRIVQEALTNVLKHADSPSGAKVLLRYDEPIVEVDVEDDGRTSSPASRRNGHGLAGMAERTAMFDGAVEAGRRPGGGWRVHTRLGDGQAVS